jgi:transposase InsO family protein/transposase-like protein
MTYRHYTKEYRDEIVNKFHKSGMKIYRFCKNIEISERTLYIWLEEDGRPFKRELPRIKTRSIFSFEIKMKAIENVVKYNRCPRAVAPEFGVTFAMLYRWLKTYKEKGEYALMSREDIENGKISNEAKLRAENEKLKDQNLKLKMENDAKLRAENEKLKDQNLKLKMENDAKLRAEIKELTHQNLKLKMENDAYKMAQELLKNYPALSWNESLQDLTNAVKIELIEKLRAKFKYLLKDLLELFALKESSYHTGKNAVKRTEAWQNRWKNTDAMVLEIIESDKFICRKQGRRVIMPMLKRAGISVSECHLRDIIKDNDLQAWQTKSMRRHNSYKNDGNPPVKNWLYDLENKVHYFNPEKPWEILGTDVTEIHVNGFAVYLSMIIDFYDGAPVTWKISDHPNTDLIVGSVEDLINIAPPKERFILHMDQGSVNRSAAMKKTCEEGHILQSMSYKGKSGDNAPTEGFFGQMKQQWFNKTKFKDATFENVVSAWNEWLNWYCTVRPKTIYGGLSVKDGRNMLEYKKVKYC